MTVQNKFTTTRAEMSAALIERSQEIDITLTALLAGENCLFVGPPGTGKTLLATLLGQWLQSAKVFNHLMNKYTTPEEVYGPVSVIGLKNDQYRRITTDKLPEAEVAFLDEIFKASTAILNTLLTILNEHAYDNGGQRQLCPLRMAIAASNEWPNDNGEGQELGALFDRFVIRCHVRPISTQAGLNRLLWDALPMTLSTTLDPQELETARAEVEALQYTEKAKQTLLEIIQAARAEGITPGDRRLRKAVKIAKAYAYLEGSQQVEPQHLDILSHVLWDEPKEQPQKLAEIIGKLANPEKQRVNELLAEVEDAISAANLRDLGEAMTVSRKLQDIHGELTKLGGPRAKQGADHVAAEVKRIKLQTVDLI